MSSHDSNILDTNSTCKLFFTTFTIHSDGGQEPEAGDADEAYSVGFRAETDARRVYNFSRACAVSLRVLRHDHLD